MNYSDIYIEDLINAQYAIPKLDLLRNKRILITGATGLVCSAIVDFLIYQNDTMNSGNCIYIAARNYPKACSRFEKHMNRPDVIFVDYDAMKEISWDFEVDYIIHGASPANPSLYVKQPVETMLTNIIGMNNILKYSRSHDVKRVLFVSSSEIYGKKENGKPYSASEYGYLDILNPRACYPSAKRACETLCASYQTEYEVECVIARLGHIYGPTATCDDTRASSQFFFDVMNGHNIIMKSPGLQLRSYCYVVDCVSAIITILLNGESSKAYNVSNPESIVTIRELAEQIAKSSSKGVLFANASDYEKKGYNMMDNSSLDSTELIELGWKGLFPLKTGVEHTLINLGMDF